MNDLGGIEAMIAGFESQPDDVLQRVIEGAQAVIAGRAAQRKKDAVDRIESIAKEHGIDLEVKKPARKRGRPAAKKPGS